MKSRDKFPNLIDSVKKVNLTYEVIIADSNWEQTSLIRRFYGMV